MKRRRGELGISHLREHRERDPDLRERLSAAGHGRPREELSSALLAELHVSLRSFRA
jgi:hypothetical protein